MAIREGLYLASEHKFQCFVLESDCAAAISSVNVKDELRIDLDNVLNDIRSLMKTSECRGLNFVPREANTKAHWLAKQTLIYKTSTGWNRRNVNGTRLSHSVLFPGSSMLAVAPISL